MNQYSANVDKIVLNPEELRRPQLDLIQVPGIVTRLALSAALVKLTTVVVFRKLVPWVCTLFTTLF